MTIFRLSGEDYTFNTKGSPLDDPERYTVFFELLGRSLSAWSRMEQLLLSLTLTINKKHNSIDLYHANPSHNFKELLNLLEKWLTEHREFQNYNWGAENFEQLRNAANFRNDIAHGYIESVDLKAGTFHLKKTYRSSKGNWNYKGTIFKIEELNHLQDNAESTFKYLVFLGESLFEKTDNA